MELHDKLVHALTEYDNKESRKRGYNRYAFGQYLIRLKEVEDDIAKGTSIRDALVAGFNGRLLDKLLKVAGEPKSTIAEDNLNLRHGWGYVPVSER